MNLEAATTVDAIGALSADGVNCVGCHAITDTNLGERENFSGGWLLDPSNRVFGPHADPFAMPMQNRTGFTPVESSHISSLESHEYLKDNRLLPLGWRNDHEDIGDVTPVGPENDTSFVGGGDITPYVASFNGTAAKVEVALVYQSLGNRWLHELFVTPTADVQAFKKMWEKIDRKPAIVGTATYP